MNAASKLGSGLKARVGILGDGVPSVNMLIRFCPPHKRVLSPLHGISHSLLSVKFAGSWITPSHPGIDISIIYIIFNGDVQQCCEKLIQERPVLSRVQIN